MLRTEKIIINDIEVEIKETSFGAQLRLEQKASEKGLDKISYEDLYKSCLSEEDYNKLGGFDNITKKDGNRLLEVYERVNRKESPSDQKGMG